MNKNNKKALAIFSIGVFFLSFILIQNQAQAATCPSLSPGNLFKVSGGSAVYVVDANLQRLYFPNSDIYYSWYKDFSNVVTLQGECVDNYPSPSAPPYGVNYRAGSRLIKVQISPTVYAIEPGNIIRKITSEQVARELYGNDWSKLVRDISDAFWPNYNNKGTDLNESIPHNGMFVKQAGSSDVYFVEDSAMKKIIGSTTADVRVISDIVFNRLSASVETKNITTIYANAPQTTEGAIMRGPVADTINSVPPTTLYTFQGQGSSTYLGLTAEGIIKWINYQRQLNNLPVLKVNTVLANMAAAKVNDLYTRKYTGHFAPDGTGGVSELADRFSYKHLTVGENIEWADFKSDDKAVVDAWMTSPLHKANILGKSWTETGISIGKAFYGGEEAWNVVQIFGAPQSLCVVADTTLYADLKNRETKMDTMLNEMSNLTVGTTEYVAKASAYNTYLAEYTTLNNKYNMQSSDFNACAQRYQNNNI